MTLQDTLLHRVRDREAVVAVVGLGYVGLPLAVAFAEAGFPVIGLDIDAERVAALAAGESHVEDVSDEVLCAALAAGMRITADEGLLAEADAISICVPTPLRKTRDPDLSHVLAASEAVAAQMRPGQLVVLESTTYPGTTRDVLVPLVEARGLTVGVDAFVVFSPERVDPGRTDWTTRTTPKVMGGVTPACLMVAQALYEAAVDTVVPVSSPEAAELTKIYENTFRAVNIGLANELMLMCDRLDLDVWEIVAAAGTKPFGFMAFTPGPGLGGHCLPVDPHYLSWKLRGLDYTARFIELASEVNTMMPRYWVRKVQDALNNVGKAAKGARVLVLGVAYKPDVSDLRESPALDVIRLLESLGAEVSFHDPHVAHLRQEDRTYTSVPDLDAALASSDAAILVTDHSAYDVARLASQVGVFVNSRGPTPTV
ncbi:nucleotide sugar dehydrogenase [Rubrivirga sp. IMCC43871]|uniref:nucleotide sugar dehydrogenase n=1 Tax=Rubrivirga sp. IMCC43871 TaxID=3391575 RepID=UPI00398FE61C